MDTCQHPDDRQSADYCTNEVLCMDCGSLRDIMEWDEHDKAHANCTNC